MATLEDIPKYAFGTTHEIEPDASAEADQTPGSSRWPTTGTSGPSPSCSSSSSSSLSPAPLPPPPPLTSSSTSSAAAAALLSATSAASAPARPGAHKPDKPSASLSSHSGPSSPKPISSKISESKFRALVLRAVQLGCRHFDCAPLYGTQVYVGAALREAMSTVPRQDFFITSKLPPNMMRPENILRSISKSIDELQCNYLDLFLIHAPFSTKHVDDDTYYPLDDEGNLLLDEQEHLLEDAWRKLVDLKRMGLTRYIGLSNVNLEQLIRLNNIHHIDVVQNEYHIYNQDREIFDYCEEIDVHFEAYAAMGNPDKARRDNKPCVALDPVVQRVARDNRLSIAEVSIQWVYQQPLSYVIRCDTPRQLEENLHATKCISLPVNDLIDLDCLNRDVRLYRFDEHRGITKHREYPFKRPAKEHKEPLGECLNQQRVQQHLARQQRRQGKSCSQSAASSSGSGGGGGTSTSTSNSSNTDSNKNSNSNNANNESDLSSSDCSDLSGEKVSSLSDLKTSLSQSDSSITTTIARSSTPSSITDVPSETAAPASPADGPSSGRRPA